MELLLNLVWLAVSAAVAGSFGLCLIAKSGRRERLAGCIALICVICLLFPVISMTDDLNSSTAMVEPTKLKKLLPAVQIVAGLLAHILIHAPGEDHWAFVVGEQLPNPRQVILFSEFTRRPPPSLQSL